MFYQLETYHHDPIIATIYIRQWRYVNNMLTTHFYVFSGSNTLAPGAVSTDKYIRVKIWFIDQWFNSDIIIRITYDKNIVVTCGIMRHNWGLTFEKRYIVTWCFLHSTLINCVIFTIYQRQTIVVPWHWSVHIQIYIYAHLMAAS